MQVERADDNLAAARAALRDAKHTYDAKLHEHGWARGVWAGRRTCGHHRNLHKWMPSGGRHVLAKELGRQRDVWREETRLVGGQDGV